jgi:hypothetical protein
MCNIHIHRWFGRTGNNLLSILFAIEFGKRNNFYSITIINHPLFSLKKKVINTNGCKCKKIITDYESFFYKFRDLEPSYLKKIYNEYVSLKFNKNDIFLSDVTFHIRGGDIMRGQGHSLYTQPPLIYYEKYIEKYIDKKITVVYEDNSNPVIDILKKKYPGINFQSNSMIKDLFTISQSKISIGSNSTFWILAFIISDSIEKVIFPDYINLISLEDWGVESEKISFPNYIKAGEWKNSPEQRKLMLEYKY